MIGFVLKRIAGYLATLASSAIVIFLAFELLWHDPAEFASGHEHPLWARLLNALAGLSRGDFGTALSDNRPVRELLLGALGVTLPLLALTAALAVAIGLSLGVLAARHTQPAPSVPSGVAAIAGIVPVVVLALLFAGIARGTALAPTEPAGWAHGAPAMLAALVLPALAAALPAAALLALRTRDAIRSVGASDFIRLARAQGLTHREAMHRTGRRNVAIAATRGLAPHAALLVAGVYVAEAGFRLPGLSALVAAGIGNRDLDVARDGTLALAGLIVTMSLLLDLVRAAIDPRIAARTA